MPSVEDNNLNDEEKKMLTEAATARGVAVQL